MRRRDFIALSVGLTGAWPLVAQAQQPVMPVVIGMLTSRGPDDSPDLIATFRQGLKDSGFTEGQNVIVESRFAANQYEQLPHLQPIWFADRRR